MNLIKDVCRLFTENRGIDRIDTFHFEIVTGCQLRCIGCPNSTLQPTVKHISPDDFSRCLANVDVGSVKFFRLYNYGEPFLHPELAALLPVVARQPWSAEQVEISTNAMIYDEQLLRKIIRSRVVTHLVVSCDGDGTPKEFERLRPPATWARLMTFLTGASRLKQEFDSSIKLMTRTICTTEEGRERWRALLTPLGWTPEFREWNLLPNTTHAPWNRKAHVYNHVCWPLQGVNLFVNCRGEVVPCCAYPDLAPLGNLKTHTFSEIFRGADRKRFINHIRTSRRRDRICSQCEQ